MLDAHRHALSPLNELGAQERIFEPREDLPRHAGSGPVDDNGWPTLSRCQVTHDELPVG
jgi:hypothetical protein